MTVDRKDLRDVLRSMEEPICNIERASDALEIIAKDPGIDAVQRGALVFVADSLLELYKRLNAAHDEAFKLSHDQRARLAEQQPLPVTKCRSSLFEQIGEMEGSIIDAKGAIEAIWALVEEGHLGGREEAIVHVTSNLCTYVRKIGEAHYALHKAAESSG